MVQSGRHTPIKNRLSGHLRPCRDASAVGRRPTVVVGEAAAKPSLMRKPHSVVLLISTADPHLAGGRHR